MRRIGRTKIVKVDGEFVVKAWDTDGKRFAEADYFTTDRADAEGTAELMLRPPSQPSPIVEYTAELFREHGSRIGQPPKGWDYL